MSHRPKLNLQAHRPIKELITASPGRRRTTMSSIWTCDDSKVTIWQMWCRFLQRGIGHLRETYRRKEPLSVIRIVIWLGRARLRLQFWKMQRIHRRVLRMELQAAEEVNLLQSMDSLKESRMPLMSPRNCRVKTRRQSNSSKTCGRRSRRVTTSKRWAYIRSRHPWTVIAWVRQTVMVKGNRSMEQIISRSGRSSTLQSLF